MDVRLAMMTLLSGEGTDETNADIIRNLDDVSDSDIISMIEIMKRFMIPVQIGDDSTIDMCGTGGDKLATFNISTAAAFVAAACGVSIAKHGNRSSSGGVGSVDILEMLGVDIYNMDAAGMLKEYNLCFLFAQRHHPAVRHVAGARRILDRRTIFNLLGPLCNPANVRCQLVGVSDDAMLHRIPRIMRGCGSTRIMSVTSENGMDELSVTSPGSICIYRNGSMTTSHIHARDLGVCESPLSDIIPDTRAESLEYFVKGISGSASDGIVNTTALNAAAGMVVAGTVDTIPEGFDAAINVIKSGKALDVLYGFVGKFGDVSVLEDMA
ncbi:MAG: anthranilate phosphoribosyltransferase [Cenarchaeum sp. SB0664_bin_35]|nr:anthranilate phosphoribosyltransferase [Cenarchaeum sp. SB0664_bin_35]